MRAERIEKICPQCTKTFFKPPSLAHIVCCSKECRALLAAASRPACGQCGEPFKPTRSGQQYCSRQCAGLARTGRAHTNRQRIEKVCPGCGETFEVTPSNAHIVTCSYKCRSLVGAGKPREFTPESYARLTGRPKQSTDVERACPTCGTTFTLPEWNPKVYCSSACYHARADRKPAVSQKIQKSCAACGQGFEVYPSQAHVKCCSRSCAASLHRQASVDAVRQMSESECTWFAGLFDGEGSIVLAHRSRADGGHVKILIYNTVLQLLERAQDVVGKGTIQTRRKTAAHHLDSWHWELGGAAALEVLRQVRPWLIVKADRADAVLAGKTFPRQARWDHIYPEADASD